MIRSFGVLSSPLKVSNGSLRSFNDMGHFRIEIPTVNSVAFLRSLVDYARSHKVVLNRITETLGLFRHPDNAIREYVQVCKDEGIQLLMSVGPRATYDTGASARTEQGRTVGYRLRGLEQVERAVVDIRRGIDLGVRGFVIYDEGLLLLIGQMREQGEIPKDVHIKASAHMGYANALSISILESLGADSINPVRDLSIASLAEMRQKVCVPLDIHMDSPKTSGGFIRFHEAHEIIRVASPVYLKTGNSILEAHGALTSRSDGEGVIYQVRALLDIIARQETPFLQSRSEAASAVEAVREAFHV